MKSRSDVDNEDDIKQLNNNKKARKNKSRKPEKDKDNDLINQLKNNIENTLQNDKEYNKVLKNVVNEKDKLRAKKDNLPDFIRDLDINLYTKEYLEYALEISNNFTSPNKKPKFIGINYLGKDIDDNENKNDNSKANASVNKNKRQKNEHSKDNNITTSNNQISINDSTNLKKTEIIATYFLEFFDAEKIKKVNTISEFKIITPLEIFYKHEYEKYHKISSEMDKCSICLTEFYDELFVSAEKLLFDKDSNMANISAIKEILNYQKSKNFIQDVILLNECSDHFFHIDCMVNMISDKEFIKCPNCSIIYGILTGNQPSGTMKVKIEKSYKCDGYKNNNTIVIQYDFPNGRSYEGTGRTGYLPDNKEGKEILALFKVAFERRILFTIGTSVTTGKNNQTVWNGIHHKTNTTGGAQYFGYPDQSYFNRVRQELAAKGIVQEHIEKHDGESLIDIANKFIKAGKVYVKGDNDDKATDSNNHIGNRRTRRN